MKKTLLIISLATLCSLICICSIIRAQEPNAVEEKTRKFDEYGGLRSSCDEGARLDAFAIALQNNPKIKGYIIVYLGKDTLPAHSNGLLKRAEGYLVNNRGILSERVVSINGGFRETRATELWIVAEGDPAPQPSNTIEFHRDSNAAYKYDQAGFDLGLTDNELKKLEDEFQRTNENNKPQPKRTEIDEVNDELDKVLGEARHQPNSVSSDGNNRTEKDVRKDEINENLSQEETEDPFVEYEGLSEDENGSMKRTRFKFNFTWNINGYASELKSAPRAHGCLIYYFDPAEEVSLHVARLVELNKKLLVEKHHIDENRIVLMYGGYSASPELEIWIVPKKSPPPMPTIYLSKAEIEAEFNRKVTSNQ